MVTTAAPKRKTRSRAVTGFTEDGQRYILRDLHLLERADADLWNDHMFLQIDHRGRCEGWFTQPNISPYGGNLRSFYVRDDESGTFWSAPYEPVQAEPESFEFNIGIGDLQWRVVNDGIAVQLRLVVPRDEFAELWTVTVTNESDRPRTISLYPYFPVESLAPMSRKAGFEKALNGMVYQGVPYYVRYEDYFKSKKLRNFVYCASDTRPAAYELSQSAFTGWHGVHNPQQLHQPRLGKGDARHEAIAAIFQYTYTLAPGESATVNLLFAPAYDRQDMARMKQKYLVKGGIERALKQVYAFHKAHAPAVRIETPDVEFNHYINHWLPNRTLVCGRALRFNLDACARNLIQDCMGILYNDRESARAWLVRAWSFQNKDGWLPHGLRVDPDATVSPINTIPHKDMNAWGAPVLHAYLGETGDFAILDEPIPFADDPAPVSLYEHINRGIDWLLNDRTERGLSRIGQGDWNDPLNMAGLEDKGESVWLSEALVYSLDQWAEVAEYRGDTKRAQRYRQEADACRQA
ncbi:MAG TPA: hypothetical protein VGM23_11770, partial [Armatimonadota bacterium]